MYGSSRVLPEACAVSVGCRAVSTVLTAPTVLSADEQILLCHHCVMVDNNQARSKQVLSQDSAFCLFRRGFLVEPERGIEPRTC
jgi:hypothetical protein